MTRLHRLSFLLLLSLYFNIFQPLIGIPVIAKQYGGGGGGGGSCFFFLAYFETRHAGKT